MKKSLIALLALTSSSIYAAETTGTIVSIQSATTLEECYTCSQINENSFNYNFVSDPNNDIVEVKTSNNKIYSFKIESKYNLKVGQQIIVDTSDKI